jgi:uncharacterized protein YndB with AHSA1/START domain
MPRPQTTRRGLIEKTVLIQARPAVIYRALTEARELVHWFCDRASAEPREGGELAAYWRLGKDATRGRAVFTRLVPQEVVELRWVDEGGGERVDPEASHVLSYTIRTRRGTSEVVVKDEDRPHDDAEDFSRLDAGWNGVLLELKDHCERRERITRRRDRSAFPAP